MPFRTYARQILLAVLLIFSVPAASAQVPSKAPSKAAYDWLFIDDYLELNQEDLALLFKNTRGGRAWNMSPVTMTGKIPSRLVSWSLANNGLIKFLIVNGRTELVVLIVGQFAYNDIEEQLNRRMTPVNERTWVDRARREWSLKPVPGTTLCALQVNLPTR